MCCGVHFSTPFMITSVGLLSRMSSNVLCQVTLSNKRLHTAFLFTPECISCVASAMSLQTVRCGELFATPVNAAVVYLLSWRLVMPKKEILVEEVQLQIMMLSYTKLLVKNSDSEVTLHSLIEFFSSHLLLVNPIIYSNFSVQSPTRILGRGWWYSVIWARYVRPQIVWFLSWFLFKWGREFDHFGLKWGMVCSLWQATSIKLERNYFLSLLFSSFQKCDSPTWHPYQIFTETEAVPD